MPTTPSKHYSEADIEKFKKIEAELAHYNKLYGTKDAIPKPDIPHDDFHAFRRWQMGEKSKRNAAQVAYGESRLDKEPRDEHGRWVHKAIELMEVPE